MTVRTFSICSFLVCCFGAAAFGGTCYAPLSVSTDCMAPFDPFSDYSKADTDGPYVFYRGKQMIVKSIVKKDSVVAVEVEKYAQNTPVVLSCSVAETGDVFSFPLKSALRVEDAEYAMPEQMLVISDIEGNFTAFKTLLLTGKVIDSEFKWTFGKGHLVLLGDFVDRGLSVTECLWLIYKLEAEAEAAGGKVHFILGNHEILNMAGNAQYVRKKYMENAALMRESFDRMFDAHSELGRWMRTKNAVEKIGEYAFCHGGISPQLVRTGFTMQEINRISRQYLGVPFESLTNEAALSVFDIKSGIFWYREIAKGLATQAEVTAALSYIGAQKIVLGHTLQPEISAYYSGRVICVDLYHEENLRQGILKTLYIHNDACYTLDSKGDLSSIFSMVVKGDR